MPILSLPFLGVKSFGIRENEVSIYPSDSPTPNKFDGPLPFASTTFISEGSGATIINIGMSFVFWIAVMVDKDEFAAISVTFFEIKYLMVRASFGISPCAFR